MKPFVSSNVQLSIRLTDRTITAGQKVNVLIATELRCSRNPILENAVYVSPPQQKKGRRRWNIRRSFSPITPDLSSVHGQD